MPTYHPNSQLADGQPAWELEPQQQLADGRWLKIADVIALSPEGGWVDVFERDASGVFMRLGQDLVKRRVHGSFRVVDRDGRINPPLAAPPELAAAAPSAPTVAEAIAEFEQAAQEAAVQPGEQHTPE